MAAFLDICRFNPTLGGTTDWVVSSAVTGYQTPASAGATNAIVYRYRAESTDLTQWEIGYGAYTVGTTTLARTTVLFNSLGTTAKINFSSAPQVAVVALKEDLLSITEANSFTAAERTQGRANLGAAINELQNVTFAVTAAGSALTIALKDAAGNDPTATTPIALSFRGATLTASPNVPTTIEVTAASSVVVPSTSTLGSASATALRIWIVGWNDGGTFRLGVYNALTPTAANIKVFPLAEAGVASSLQVVAAGNTAGQHYTAGAAVTSKAFRILGFVDWTSSGVATAGTWTTTNLNSIATFGPGMKKPGDIVQVIRQDTGTVATGTTVIPFDNTIPQNTEGDQYMSVTIVPTSACNVERVKSSIFASCSVTAQLTAAIFRDTTANALFAISNTVGGAFYMAPPFLDGIFCFNTAASTDIKMRMGGSSASTTTFNGQAGAQIYGGVANSCLMVEEIMV
jgi:hypothetical protein